MYVSVNDPLPRNSVDPVTSCESVRAAAIVSSLEQSVNNAYLASTTIAGPSSFSSLGPAVVTDVARSQNALAAATLAPGGSSLPGGAPASSPQSPVNVAQAMMAAPVVLPLNVSVAEYSGCGLKTRSLQPIPLPAQSIVMPPAAPSPVSLPQTASAPKYKNICWALRNGAVDRSQFDPAELTAAQFACMKKGYTGGCVPPPAVALWLDQQRRAGTLPHIAVRQSDLDAIPQAPPLEGLTCPQSWALAGMSGYGMGAPWGDSASVPCGGTWMKARPGVSLGTLGWFALAAAGLFAMGGRR